MRVAVPAGRRSMAGLVALWIATVALSLASAANAANTATFRPSFSDGGLGDGATATLALSFEGNEYFGGPPPLTNLVMHLPEGVGGSRSGFASCSASTLEVTGPFGCPPGSSGGPAGSIVMRVVFGTEFVSEPGTVQTFFGPGETIYFYVNGNSPVSVEFLMSASYVPDASPFGAALNIAVPLVTTVPGAPQATILSLALGFGASRREQSSEVQALTIPSDCPRGGFDWRADAGFNDTTSLQVTYKSPCPTRAPTSPLLGQREGVAVTGGQVTVRPKGSASFVALKTAGSIPDGSEINTTRGRARIATATPISGQTQSAEVRGGRSVVHQDPTAGATEFSLSGPLAGCRRRAGSRAVRANGSSRVASHAHPKARRLWVSEGGGKWSTKGRYVSTTVVGTSWLTQDECRRSLVRVASGTVAVHDLLRGSTKLLFAGGSYVAARRSAKGHR
jgi:hypothetical protein